ncbi:MAG TPA: hypothetical protein VHF47_00190 [Acidimicrobiales bacterium]|nr:hypothetical protein [Acidimicrobiales bacterium]
MRRRLVATLSVLALSVPVAAFRATPPASANVCTFVADVQTSGPMYFPGAVTLWTGGGVAVTVHALPVLVGFGWALTGDACAPAWANPAADGMISGYCGHFWAVGITRDGHRFALVSAGGVVVATGGMTGVGAMTADILDGQSCAVGATGHILAMEVLLYPCNVLKSKSDLLPIVNSGTSTTTTVGTQAITVSVPPGNYHVWTKTCLGVK